MGRKLLFSSKIKRKRNIKNRFIINLFTSLLLKEGKRTIAQKLILDALKYILIYTKKDPFLVFQYVFLKFKIKKRSLINIKKAPKPKEHRSKKNKEKVRLVKEKKSIAQLLKPVCSYFDNAKLTLKLLLKKARKHKGKSFSEKLAHFVIVETPIKKIKRKKFRNIKLYNKKFITKISRKKKNIKVTLTKNNKFSKRKKFKKINKKNITRLSKKKNIKKMTPFTLIKKKLKKLYYGKR